MPQFHSSKSVLEPPTVGRGKRLYRGAIAIGVVIFVVLQLYPTILVFLNLAISGVVAEAIMTGLEKQGAHRGTSYRPIFEFSLGDGDLATAKSYSSISHREYRKEKRIKVVYLPTDPQIVVPRIHLVFWQLFGFWLAGAGCLAGTILGFSELKKAVYPPKHGVESSDK